MTDTKKELGQHWLTDPGILQVIVKAGDISESDHVLEIGSGQGTLTEVLVKTAAHITALEFDAELVPKLEKRFAQYKKCTIKHGDIRKFDYTVLPKDYKIIANIPYYLTSDLIRAISETNNPPKLAVLLVQKEVAERLCAQPGQMSVLAATAQFYFDCQLDIDVPAQYFTPPPKVDSQVVILTRRTSKLFDVNEKQFFTLVKAGFSEKRKTLRNSLSGGLHMAKDDVESMLRQAELEPGARAQQLSLDQWYQLYLVYGSQRTPS